MIIYKEDIDKRHLFRGLDKSTNSWVYGRRFQKDGHTVYIESQNHGQVEIYSNTFGELYRTNGSERWFEGDVILTYGFPHEGDDPQFFVVTWNEYNHRLQLMDMDDCNYFDLDTEVHDAFDYELIGNIYEDMILTDDCFRWLLKRNKTLMSRLEDGVGIKEMKERSDFKRLVKAAHKLKIKRSIRERKKMELLKMEFQKYKFDSDELPF